MLLAALAALLVATADPTAAARAELDNVARRIAVLKERRLTGHNVDEELTRLLVRSEELAAQIERHAPKQQTAHAPGPSPEELRERADAVRDEADRVAAQVEDVDRSLEEVDRERRREAALEALASDSALFGESDLAGGHARSSTSGTASSAAAAADGSSSTALSAQNGASGSSGASRAARAERSRAAAVQARGASEVRALQQQRAALVDRLDALRTDAARLDAAAARAAKEE